MVAYKKVWFTGMVTSFLFKNSVFSVSLCFKLQVLG